ncbi:MAG TPA: arylamine N-acetyltransferase [Ktedonobacterales bacterium]|nr:arylamine N-acetyltransferase [Ktedonobacterales bacterium]
MSANALNPAAYKNYLDRIDFSAPMAAAAPAPSLATLQALHLSHMLAVPFENLSIHYGEPIILEEAALFNKIVGQRRGGFCYELNGLFAWLLRTLGFQVTLLSAGVAHAEGGFGPEFDHLTLLVQQLSDTDWLADVGFGDSFRQPLRFEADLEQQDADGNLYRLLREGQEGEDGTPRDYWILQRKSGEQWEPQYRFTLQPHILTDYTERCHYHQTSPESHFTQKRVCSLATPMGRITLSDLLLIRTVQGKRKEELLPSEVAYKEVLANRFGIVL